MERKRRGEGPWIRGVLEEGRKRLDENKRGRPRTFSEEAGKPNPRVRASKMINHYKPAAIKSIN